MAWAEGVAVKRRRQLSSPDLWGRALRLRDRERLVTPRSLSQMYRPPRNLVVDCLREQIRRELL